MAQKFSSCPPDSEKDWKNLVQEAGSAAIPFYLFRYKLIVLSSIRESFSHHTSDQMSETVLELNINLFWRKVPWSVTSIISSSLSAYSNQSLKHILIRNFSDNCIIQSLFCAAVYGTVMLWWLNGNLVKYASEDLCPLAQNIRRKHLVQGCRAMTWESSWAKHWDLFCFQSRDSWFSSEFVSHPCVQLIKFVCRCPEDYIDSYSCLHLKWQEVEEHELTWYDKWKN